MKRKILSAILVILLVTATLVPVTASAASTSSFNTEVRQSIAPIAVYRTVDGLYAYGTCFFIGDTVENPQYVVTNHHVVETYLEEGAGETVTYSDGTNYISGKVSMRVYFDSDDFVEAYVVAYNESADLAILRLENPTDKRTALKLKLPTEDMIGSTVYAVGYPSLSDNVYKDPVSHWSIEDATVTTGSISRLLTTSGTGVKQIQMDANISGGNSGGPLVDTNGYVIGINASHVANASDAVRVNYAINVEELISLCDANSIPYTLAGEASGNLLWIVIGIVAIAVIALVVVLVLRKKKAAPAADPAPVSVPASAPVVSADPIPAAPVAGDPNALRFQCTKGVFAGKRFSIDGTVRIGRDPSKNDLVYPSNTQGVSGVHCILILKDGVLYLQDLGSTYGTFVNGGQRLAANQPVALKIGDRFSLGSDRESFVITPRGGL